MTPGLFRVDLFGNDLPPSSLGRATAKMECLEALCRYGIQKLRGRRAMVRPHVTVTGLANLEPVLHGYQAAVLQRALEIAGAIVFGEADAV